MATPTEAREAVKSRLDIPAAVDTFDTMIDGFVTDAVSRLSPTVYHEVDPEEVDVTVSSRGQAIVDLSTMTTPLDDVREVEAITGADVWPLDDFRVHARKLRVRGLSSDITTLSIAGLKEHALSTVPSYLLLPVYYFAMSEFFSTLMSNKAKYNVYMQNGAAAVDNMQDLVDFWEQKGLNYLSDKAVPYGR